MSRSGHNPRYDAGVRALMAKRDAGGQIANRPHASGEAMADGCWSCTHYQNWGGNTNGTPPWSTCRFRLDHPECGRWELVTDAPWRFDDDWRNKKAEPPT